MRKLLLLLLTLTLVLGVFISCDNGATNDTSDTTNQETNAETTTETTPPESFESTNITTDTEDSVPNSTKYNYTVKKTDGEYYLIPDKYPQSSSDQKTDINVSNEMFLPSLDVLKYDIPQGKLSDELKTEFICRFGNPNVMDFDIAVGIPLYNIEHIWQPTFSDRWIFEDGVYCYGGSYFFKGIGHSQSTYNETVKALIVRKDEYNEILDSYKKDSTVITLQNETKIVNYTYNSYDSDHNYFIFIETDKYCAILSITTFSSLTDDEITAFAFEEYLG